MKWTIAGRRCAVLVMGAALKEWRGCGDKTNIYCRRWEPDCVVAFQTKSTSQRRKALGGIDILMKCLRSPPLQFRRWRPWRHENTA